MHGLSERLNVTAVATALIIVLQVCGPVRAESSSAKYTVQLQQPGGELGDPGGHQVLSAPGHRAVLKGSEPTADMPQRQRAPQLSEDQLVIVALDSKGAEVSRQFIQDPALLRVETRLLSSDGGSERRYLGNVELSFVIPDADQVQTVEIFRPKWDGETFSLDSLGRIEVR